MPARRPAIDRAWFADRLRASPCGSARQAALRLGINPSALTRTLAGERRLRLEEARGLADLLGVALGDVLAHAGIAMPAGPPIVGILQGDGHVDLQRGRALGHAPALAEVPPGAIAILARTAGGDLDHLDGVVLIAAAPAPPSAATIGRLAVLRGPDGDRLGTLRRALGGDRYAAAGFPGAAGVRRLDDLAVAAVAVVLWMRWP